MSHENKSTDDHAHSHSTDERLFESGSSTLARQITEDNKIKSPLMRLPAEIRVIILRVLVGDKLIHVFTTRQGQESADEQHWTLARRLSLADDPIDHCPNYGWGNHFDILDASHQLHREAFTLFWQTCQFSFRKEKDLAQFVNRLGEAQKAHLKRLVINADISVTDDWNTTNGQGPWASYFFGSVNGFPLVNVCDLVLNMKLHVGAGDVSFEGTLNRFEPLRLLALKKAKVRVLWYEPPSIPFKHLARLEYLLSQSLLYPTITKADLVNLLTKRIQRVERPENEARSFAQRDLLQAEESEGWPTGAGTPPKSAE